LTIPSEKEPRLIGAEGEMCGEYQPQSSYLKFKLRKVVLDFKEIINCVLARGILEYTGTYSRSQPLEERKIDRIKTQLIREVNGLPNVISNRANMNVACSMKNAWEIVEQLA
jgi:hypothetical protein